MIGFLEYINDFVDRIDETLHIEFSNELVSLFFNCKAESVEDVLSKPIRRDYAEISFY